MGLAEFGRIRSILLGERESFQRLRNKMSFPRIPADSRLQSRFRGCLLGGAVGDALGAPVEFLDLDEIVRAYGEAGIRDYAPAYGKLGAITDDTQMTLFTAEAVLSAHLAALLQSQETDFFRAAAASYMMRMAPVGMYFAHSLSRERNPGRLLSNVFTTGGDLAAITHGHPSGCLSAGTFAVIVGLTLVGKSLTEAIHSAKEELRKHPSHKETLAAVEKAESLAKSRPRERSALRELGKGFVAEEALAMGIYCALGAKDFEDGIILAVNHSGDSDSTGSITGNLLGAGAGVEAIPERWLARLELRSTIEAIADDLAAFPDWRLRSQGDVEERAFYASRYPVA